MDMPKLLQGVNLNINHAKAPYYLDEHSTVYRKAWDGSSIFHAIMVPQKLQSYILYESHIALGHNESTRLYNFIKKVLLLEEIASRLQ